MPGARSWVRDNAFLVAAAALPLVVGAVFLAASAVPRWTSPAPQYDCLIEVERPYDTDRPFGVDFNVRDGRVVAMLRAPGQGGYSRRTVLLRVDHTTLRATEVPVTHPDRLEAGETERIVSVPGFENVTLSTLAEAPDGYSMLSRYGSGPGLVGEIFGMRRSRQNVMLGHRGRSVSVALPDSYADLSYGTSFVAWILDHDAR